MADFRTKIVISAEAAQALAQLSRVAGQFKALGRDGTRAGAELASGFSVARRGVASISEQLAQLRRDAIKLFSLRLGFNLSRDIFNAAAGFESLEKGLEAVLGSSEAAREALAFVRAESARLGIGLEGAAQQFTQMAAAARGTALEGEPVRRLFSATAQAATVLGLSGEQLGGAFTALQQIISKGRVSAEELRGQLGERLFGAMQIAARAIGLTTEELDRLLQKGLLPADKFLPAFAAQLDREFGDKVPQATRSARAELARFQNQVLELQLAVAQSGFLAALTEGFRQLAATLQDPGFQAVLKSVGEFVGTTIKWLVDHRREVGIALAALGGARVGAGIGRVLGPKGALAGGALVALGAGVSAALATSGEAELRTLEDLARRRAEINRELEALTAREQALAPGRGRFERERIGGRRATLLAELESISAELERLEAEARSAAREKDRLLEPPKAKPFDFRALLGQDKERARTETAARLAAAKEAAAAEFALLKDGLERAQGAYDAALEDRLLSLRGYYAAKTAIDQSQIDAEIRRTQALLAEQRRLLASAAEEPERLRARGEIAKLEAELIVLNRRRADAERENARAAAQAERALAEELARVREELAALTGAGGAEERRAAIAREFRELKARLAAEGDAEGVSLVDRLIDVKAAQANLAKLESEWRLVTERMRNAQEAIEVQSQAGLLTEAQARRQIVELQQQSALEMERLLPAMEAAASALGPEAVERVRAFANELGRTKIVVDDLAVTINGQFQDAFAGLFESVISGAKSAKDAFLDFGRSILATINRIIAQKFAEQLFEGFGKGGKDGGIGGAIADFFKGFKLFSGGGYVSGPGSSTSDSIPAWLSDGEYVIRAAAVRQWGVAFLDAVNGLAARPRLPRFADGGLVAAAPSAAPPIVVQMTIQTPDAASFRRSQGQIAADMRLALERAGRNL